jgi:SAM-dependent methyltransferase
VNAKQNATFPTTCNLCGKADTTFIAEQNSFKIVECNLCGFVYVNPRPKANALKAFYTDYHQNRIGEPMLWKPYMHKIFTKSANLLGKLCPQKGKLLDIGCGYGFFLEEATKRGWQASGIDLSQECVAFAKERGQKAELALPEDIKEKNFDAITMFYVLEHLPDPLATLRTVRKLLKPGGVLLLRVPHTTPIVKRLKSIKIKNNLFDPPFHLCDFSPETLAAMLKKAGFKYSKTMIGGGTTSPKILPAIITNLSTATAELLYRFSNKNKKYLMPGVSKTTVAKKS